MKKLEWFFTLVLHEMVIVNRGWPRLTFFYRNRTVYQSWKTIIIGVKSFTWPWRYQRYVLLIHENGLIDCLYVMKVLDGPDRILAPERTVILTMNKFNLDIWTWKSWIWILKFWNDIILEHFVFLKYHRIHSNFILWLE